MGLVTVPNFVAKEYIINDFEVSKNKDPLYGLLNVLLILRLRALEVYKKNKLKALGYCIRPSPIRKGQTLVP